MLEFVCVFMFERFAFMFDEFMLLIGVLGGAIVGAGVEVFRFVRFALLLALFAVLSPQPKPMAPIAKTAVIAIFFIILNALLSSLRFEVTAGRRPPCPN